MYAKRPAFSLTNGRPRKGKEGKDVKDSKGREKGEKEQPQAVRSKSLAELLEEEESGRGPKLEEALLAVFRLIDADNGGTISKLEFIGAVYRHALVASFVLQGEDISKPWFNVASLGLVVVCKHVSTWGSACFRGSAYVSQ